MSGISIALHSSKAWQQIKQGVRAGGFEVRASCAHGWSQVKAASGKFWNYIYSPPPSFHLLSTFTAVFNLQKLELTPCCNYNVSSF